jgi:uncharacterized phage protein gp47/JayE
MAFRLLTLDGLSDVAVAVARALLPTRDWSRRKPPWKFLRSIAVIATDLQAQLADAMLDLLPDTARGPGPGRPQDMLARWGNLKRVPRKGATVARGTDAGRVTGTAASTIAAGALLTHEATGQKFMLGGDVTIPASPTYLDVDIVSVSPGSAARLSKGEVLVVDDIGSYPGINERIVLVADLDAGGDDAEPDGPYRTRVLDSWSNPPLGGAQNDYVNAALDITGIDAAYSYPNRKGLGSVDLAVLHAGTGSARAPTSGERTAVLAQILTGTARVWKGKPVGADLSRILVVTTVPVDVELEILPNGEEVNEFDWNDQTPLVVAAWTNGSNERLMQFTTDRPDSMEAGGTIVVKDLADVGDGALLTIESLSGTDSIVLEAAPSVAPVAGDVVYAGGPLTDPVRDALLDHIDELGTANPDAAPYGAWEANVRPEALEAIARAITGVKTAIADAPVATFEPADPEFPLDDGIELAVPGRVIVRRRWP